LLHHLNSISNLLLVTSVMSSLSHSTQDLYPDILKSKQFSNSVVSYMAMFYNVGAILGAVFFGHVSQRLGRRRSIIYAISLSLLSIPAWAFGHSLSTLVAGSFLM